MAGSDGGLPDPTLQIYPEIPYLSIIPTQSWSLGPTHLQGRQTKRDHPLNQGQVMSRASCCLSSMSISCHWAGTCEKLNPRARLTTRQHDRKRRLGGEALFLFCVIFKWMFFGLRQHFCTFWEHFLNKLLLNLEGN